eukprot:366165_1
MAALRIISAVIVIIYNSNHFNHITKMMSNPLNYSTESDPALLSMTHNRYLGYDHDENKVNLSLFTYNKQQSNQIKQQFNILTLQIPQTIYVMSMVLRPAQLGSCLVS